MDNYSNSSLAFIYNCLYDWLQGQLVSAVEYPLITVAESHDPIIKNMGSNFGLYILYLNGSPLYAGKVSGKKDKLRRRLRQHLAKIRISIIDPEQVTCRLIPIPEKELILSLEEMLIKYLQPPWNGIDFGGNLTSIDEKTRRSPSKWCSQFLKTTIVGV